MKCSLILFPNENNDKALPTKFHIFFHHYLQVNELGNPKNKGKVKEVPANSEICEPCRNYLENGEDIPLPLLAKLVKFRLLDVKQKDLKRRESDKKVKTIQ